MDAATALTVAQTLFATLQCPEVRKLCSIFNYESELEKLLETVEIIKKCLLDADSKCQELTNEGQYCVQNLKDAVYDADDLLDEFNTIAHQLKGMPGGKIFKKVRRFFSSNNQLMFAVNKSNEIKKLREKLDSLAKNRRDFGFSELYKPVKRREETCSYVYEQSIIGRDADKETIVDLLLNESEKNISFVTIVGIGGLGKTALAQLVFSDHRIKDAFQENMYWVCVSESFDRNWILSKIHKEKNKEECTLEGLYTNVRQLIEGKRYLLVLDDVWSEDSKNWDKLSDFLILGGKGSRILVTSRSKKVAEAIGKCQIHELQGLSNEESWELFKIISLQDREDKAVTDLVEIGRDIVKKCVNVPLSIRVVASLLRNQDIATWQSFKSNHLANMCDDEGGIMPTLMFSYYHLAHELKSCFSFCSLFPEDYVIDKTQLIRLWMAQGYLVPSATDESMEDVGEKYVSILLHRCFFQDIKRDKFGKILSFKMHDLIHELARKVAAKDSLTLSACTTDSEGKPRHLFANSNEGISNLFLSNNYPFKTLRTYLKCSTFITCHEDEVILNCRCLRVLDLHRSMPIRNITDKLGRLLHLRYLDLSYNRKLEMLPRSITKLHNLQTLLLCYCNELKELPEDSNKLVNLRVLDIRGCEKLSHMPAGMGRLTHLHTLFMYIVCGDDEKGNLGDLIALINNLRGNLIIRHGPISSEVSITYLSSLKLRCKLESYQKEGRETLLESLFLNFQFQNLLCCIACTKLPNWTAGPVRIHLTGCDELQYLPSSLSQLCHLKSLSLESMEILEYVESNAPSSSAQFFPALEELNLIDMPSLKGWWRDIRWTEKEPVFIPSFPPLRELNIDDCKGLTYIPPCPFVEWLRLYKVNELGNCMKVGRVESNPVSLDNSCIFNSFGNEFSGINMLQKKKKLSGNNMCIQLADIKTLATSKEAIRSCTSSLRDLDISNCRGLENLGMEHLTNLKSLTLKNNLKGIPWRSLHSLSSLEIIHIDEIMLPKEIKYLTSLQSLTLTGCFLKSLPDELRCLTSLTTLSLNSCGYRLCGRCREPDGEDWLKICHIPNLHIPPCFVTTIRYWESSVIEI